MAACLRRTSCEKGILSDLSSGARPSSAAVVSVVLAGAEGVLEGGDQAPRRKWKVVMISLPLPASVPGMGPMTASMELFFVSMSSNTSRVCISYVTRRTIFAHLGPKSGPPSCLVRGSSVVWRPGALYDHRDQVAKREVPLSIVECRRSDLPVGAAGTAAGFGSFCQLDQPRGAWPSAGSRFESPVAL